MSSLEMYSALKELFIVNLSTSEIDELLNKQNTLFEFINGVNKEEAINAKFVEIENITAVVNESRGIGNHIIEPDKVRMLKGIFSDRQLEVFFENVALAHNNPTYAQYIESIFNWTKHLNSIDQARNISIAIVSNNNRYSNEAKEMNEDDVRDLVADIAELEEFRKAAAKASKSKKAMSKANKGKKMPGRVYCDIHKWYTHTTDQCREKAKKGLNMTMNDGVGTR